ncbi:hypothetical protein [Psychrobacillus sp.]|uniref:hypothetical protein n=1 Tax=Psychrobacillus sp. TaxID=1871623 RepID=UPI0028BDA697|nr:hypothetical protein [Psychrobacillus sp.]
MNRIVYILLSIILGLFIIYSSFNIIGNFRSYNFTGAILVIIAFSGFIYAEYLLIRRYKRLSTPEAIKLKHQKKAMIREHQKRVKIENLKRESMVPGSKARIKLFEADRCILAKHLIGLPLLEGIETYIYRCKDKVIFEHRKDTFKLEIIKVKDIILKTEIEIKKDYVNGNGLIYKNIFGNYTVKNGVREIETKYIKKFLIFSYEKDWEINYIAFEVTKVPKAALFVDYYEELNMRENQIQSL